MRARKAVLRHFLPFRDINGHLKRSMARRTVRCDSVPEPMKCEPKRSILCSDWTHKNFPPWPSKLIFIMAERIEMSACNLGAMD